MKRLKKFKGTNELMNKKLIEKVRKQFFHHDIRKILEPLIDQQKILAEKLKKAMTAGLVKLGKTIPKGLNLMTK